MNTTRHTQLSFLTIHSIHSFNSPITNAPLFRQRKRVSSFPPSPGCALHYLHSGWCCAHLFSALFFPYFSLPGPKQHVASLVSLHSPPTDSTVVTPHSTRRRRRRPMEVPERGVGDILCYDNPYTGMQRKIPSLRLPHHLSSTTTMILLSSMMMLLLSWTGGLNANNRNSNNRHSDNNRYRLRSTNRKKKKNQSTCFRGVSTPWTFLVY